MNEALEMSTRDFGEAKTEWGTAVTRYISGYPANQPTNGSRFHTGGGDYYSESGGPIQSLTISFGDPFGIVNVGVSIGETGSSGAFVEAPDTANYYKLYIVKTVEVQLYIAYYRDAEGLPWQVVYVGESSVVTNVTAYAVAVG